jgi:uncharacterized protein (DUF1778 family)
MATKKTPRKSSKPRPDKYSKKRSGYISQSLRLTSDENKLLRQAAGLEGFSINFWSVRTLVAAAKKQIAAAETPQP